MKTFFLLSLLAIGSFPTWNGCNQNFKICEYGPDPRDCPPQERQDYGTAGCELRIKLPAQMRLDGQDQCMLYIKNLGTRPVTLVAPGDGSVAGWRTPILHWSFLPSDSWESHPAPAAGAGGRCGNINSLEPKEVFQLAPGEEKELAWWHLFTGDVEPGNYRVRLYYDNIPDIKWRGIVLPQHDVEAMQRVKNSTPVSLVSNEVEVEVLPSTPVPPAG